MTDEEVDGRLRQIPVINEIQDDIAQTKVTFDERFEKGTRRMGAIEKDINDIKHNQKDSFLEVIGLITGLEKTIKDEQIKELKDELKARKDHSFTWVHGLVLVGASGAFSVIIYLLQNP